MYVYGGVASSPLTHLRKEGILTAEKVNPRRSFRRNGSKFGRCYEGFLSWPLTRCLRAACEGAFASHRRRAAARGGGGGGGGGAAGVVRDAGHLADGSAPSAARHARRAPSAAPATRRRARRGAPRAPRAPSPRRPGRRTPCAARARPSPSRPRRRAASATTGVETACASAQSSSRGRRGCAGEGGWPRRRPRRVRGRQEAAASMCGDRGERWRSSGGFTAINV